VLLVYSRKIAETDLGEALICLLDLSL